MCGRYRLGISEEDMVDFIEILREVKANISKNPWPSSVLEERDYHPGHQSPLLTKEGFKVMDWGFPLDKKLIFNAREETLFEKKMFKASAYSKRCIVPCQLFYEWKTVGKEKTKYNIQTKDNLFYLGGIFDKIIDEKGLVKEVFALITKSSYGDMMSIHHREPLVIPKERIPEFLSPSASNTEDFLTYPSPEFIYLPLEKNQQLSLF